MTMDHSKRPGDNMEQNGDPPDAKKSKSDENQNSSFTNGISQNNSRIKCPVCLWPLGSSRCYHYSADQQDSKISHRRS